MPYKPTPPLIRFDRDYIPEPNSGCWLWVGTLDSHGYAKFFNGSISVPGYRWAYEQFVGPIPRGLVIDHKCRVISCVNPAHLEPVTMRVNTLRGFGPSARNARQTHCLRGHLLAGENLLMNGGRRCCRTCKRAYERGVRLRKRLAQAATDGGLHGRP